MSVASDMYHSIVRPSPVSTNGDELELPRLLDGGVLFPEQGGPDAHHALAEALRSLADTADALRRLAKVLEAPSQNNLPAKESHQNGAHAANGSGWPIT